jgi:hypothetical protein
MWMWERGSLYKGGEVEVEGFKKKDAGPTRGVYDKVYSV